jgi:nucleoside phosphorylase
LTGPAVILVAACDAEWSAVRAELGVSSVPPVGQVVEARGDLGLLRLGVGLEAARASSAALIEAGPRVVVHVGFAGGLRTGVTAGGVLLVTAVSSGPFVVGSSDSAPAQEPLDAELIDRLRTMLARTPERLAQGALLTVDRFVDRADEKGALGRSTSYLACEMEACVVKAACDGVGARYIGVRSISDAEHESVPPLTLRGAVRHRALGRFGRWAVRPQAALEAWNFVQGGRRARNALGRVIPQVVAVAQAAAGDGR